MCLNRNSIKEKMSMTSRIHNLPLPFILAAARS
jgi:hypothetical protein